MNSKTDHSLRRKIIHINKAYHPEIGGVETVCQQYAEYSTKIFDEVLVVTIAKDKGFGWHRDTVNGVEILRFHHQFKMGGHRFSIGLFLYLLVKSFSSACFHAHDPFPLATLAFFFRTPARLVVTYHSDIIKQSTLKLFVDTVRRSVLNRAFRVTVTSPNLRDNSDSMSNRVKAKALILPLYLSSESDYRNIRHVSDIRSKHVRQLDVSTPFILVVGRINYYKGIGKITQAVARCLESHGKLEIRIVIAGSIADTKTRGDVRQLIELDPKIIVIDQMLHTDDKLYLLQHCKALLFPSNYRTEAFGIVQLEAMAAGKPVINLNLQTGVPWVSRHGVTGYTFDLDDIDGLSDLLANHDAALNELAKLSGNCAEEVASRFSKAKHEKTLAKLYRECL